MHCTSKVLKQQHCSTNKYTTTKYKLLSDLRNAGIEYFSNKLELNKSDIIGDKLAIKITSNISPLSFVNNIPNSMAMSEASPNEVLQIIQSLKKIQVWIG